MKKTLRQIRISNINYYKRSFSQRLKVYSKKYNVTGWTVKFTDTARQWEACAGYVNFLSKTMYIDTGITTRRLPIGFRDDLFLHEFAHILKYEKGRDNDYCYGMYNFKTRFSDHGRTFRKYCRLLGAGKQIIPNYKNEYINPYNKLESKK